MRKGLTIELDMKRRLVQVVRNLSVAAKDERGVFPACIRCISSSVYIYIVGLGDGIIKNLLKLE